MRSEIGSGYYSLVFSGNPDPMRVKRLVDTYFSDVSPVPTYATVSEDDAGQKAAAAHTPFLNDPASLLKR